MSKRKLGTKEPTVVDSQFVNSPQQMPVNPRTSFHMKDDILHITKVTRDEKNIHFKEIKMNMKMHFLPFFVGRLQQGVDERLNRYLMKYVEDLGGIVLAYSDVRLLCQTARVINELPHIHFPICVTMLVFCPCKGSKLLGTVNKLGEDHIGLLVYGVFNGSISHDTMRISCKMWEKMNGDSAGVRKNHSREDFTDGMTHSDGGAWINVETKKTIDVGSEIIFEVIELVQVNDTLTLYGSLIDALERPCTSPESIDI